MRFWLWKCKNFLKTLFTLGVLTAFAFGLSLCSVQRFSDLEGERVFYLNSASSQGLRKQTLEFSDMFCVKGESVRFFVPNGDGEALAKRFMEAYGATLVCVEEAAGVISYYAYTPNWSDGVYINGEKVNLHVAYCEQTQTGVVGSPIIFDGY